MSTLDQEIEGLKNWTLAGTSSGGVYSTITVPDTANQVNIVVIGGTTYSSIMPLNGSTLSGTWMIGGYYASSSDWGFANVNVSNNGKSFQLRNAKYAGSDYKSSATMYVYYK